MTLGNLLQLVSFSKRNHDDIGDAKSQVREIHQYVFPFRQDMN